MFAITSFSVSGCLPKVFGSIRSFTASFSVIFSKSISFGILARLGFGAVLSFLSGVGPSMV